MTVVLEVKYQPVKIAGIHTVLVVNILEMSHLGVAGFLVFFFFKKKSTLSSIFTGDLSDKKKK